MDHLLLAGIDLTESHGVVDIRDLPFKITSELPSVNSPKLVLVHNNDRDQHDVETYRLYLAWESVLLTDGLLPLERIKKVSDTIALFDRQVVTPEGSSFLVLNKSELHFGIYSIGSDRDEPPAYYSLQ